MNSNIHFIHADLGESIWQALLTTEGFSADKKTICICEGLTMYLTLDEVTSLLSTLLKLLPDESRLILSFMDPDKNTKSEKLTDNILSKTNEKYKMNLAVADVPEFMFNHGFSVVECLPRIEIQKSLGLTESKMKYSEGLSENYFLAKPNSLGAILQPVTIYRL